MNNLQLQYSSPQRESATSLKGSAMKRRLLGGVAVAIAAFAWVGGLAYALVKSAIFVFLNAF